MPEVEEQLRRHATWIRDQMRPVEIPTGRTPDLHLTPAPAASDPRAPVGDVVAEPAVAGRHRRHPDGWRTWAAVAAVAVLLVGGATAVVAKRSSRQSAPTTSGSVTATGPRSSLVPTWLPAGLKLWVLTTEQPGDLPYPHDLSTGPYATQLFGSRGQPEVEIKIQPTSGQLINYGGSPNLRVRGVPAIVDTERQAGGGPVNPAPDGIGHLTWVERGAVVVASFKTMSTAELTSFVDGLKWAGPKATDGFVAPAADGLQPLAPTLLAADSDLGLSASFQYAPDPNSTDRLEISTCPDGIGECSGMAYDNYLDVWLHGRRNADGSATVEHLEPNGGVTYQRAWPHGGAIELDTDGVRLGATSLERLLGGIRLTDEAGLQRLRADISARALRLPLLASTDMPGGHVELRGSRDGGWAVCLGDAALALTCPEVPVSPPGNSIMTLPHGMKLDYSKLREADVSILFHGHWLAAAVTVRPGAVLSFPILRNSVLPGPTTTIPASTQSVRVGGTTYHFGFVRVPDSAYEIGIVENTGASSASGGASRPGF